ncbi:hypothetical protein DL89DRAFT_263933 [Linderina pennispora]|uniref:Uncharacterized protein n=1 Tax=Linderina pennispora TaxID=61395 RepID=A0A1Y1WK54_9FUNG|nr:uncharacterized protein DL89DRAFT_263933 [Linderina pennispora]ORX73917.1 hypothetical protein DL89DRAFT_263933 [Linderina pennispora]
MPVARAWLAHTWNGDGAGKGSEAAGVITEWRIGKSPVCYTDLVPRAKAGSQGIALSQKQEGRFGYA